MRKGFERFYPRLREAGLPKLADHFEKALHLERLNVSYLPPAGMPPWDVEE